MRQGRQYRGLVLRMKATPGALHQACSAVVNPRRTIPTTRTKPIEAEGMSQGSNQLLVASTPSATACTIAVIKHAVLGLTC